MSKIAVVGLARTGSTRLPNKVIYDLGGKPAFVQILERITHYLSADYVVIACTRDARDDPIELLAKRYGIDCFRGNQSMGARYVSVANKLGIKEDDWWVGAPCDGALGLAEWIPWAIEQADEYGCDSIFVDIPQGTLVAGFWTLAIPGRWHFVRQALEKMTAIDELGGATFGPDEFHFGAKKYLVVHFPPEYLVSWPWGHLTLDHPVQALVIKEIYRQLYKGKPIDALDVYRLFQREPRIAQMIPLTLPLANQPVLPGQEQSPILASIRLNAEVVELTWEGG